LRENLRGTLESTERYKDELQDDNVRKASEEAEQVRTLWQRENLMLEIGLVERQLALAEAASKYFTVVSTDIIKGTGFDELTWARLQEKTAADGFCITDSSGEVNLRGKGAKGASVILPGEPAAVKQIIEGLKRRMKRLRQAADDDQFGETDKRVTAKTRSLRYRHEKPDQVFKKPFPWLTDPPSEGEISLEAKESQPEGLKQVIAEVVQDREAWLRLKERITQLRTLYGDTLPQRHAEVLEKIERKLNSEDIALSEATDAIEEIAFQLSRFLRGKNLEPAPEIKIDPKATADKVWRKISEKYLPVLREGLRVHGGNFSFEDLFWVSSLAAGADWVGPIRFAFFEARMPRWEELISDPHKPEFACPDVTNLFVAQPKEKDTFMIIFPNLTKDLTFTLDPQQKQISWWSVGTRVNVGGILIREVDIEAKYEKRLTERRKALTFAQAEDLKPLSFAQTALFEDYQAEARGLLNMYPNPRFLPRACLYHARGWTSLDLSFARPRTPVLYMANPSGRGLKRLEELFGLKIDAQSRTIDPGRLSPGSVIGKGGRTARALANMVAPPGTFFRVLESKSEDRSRSR
jgi:hypothetical protein